MLIIGYLTLAEITNRLKFPFPKNYHDQAGVLDEVEIKVENDAALGTDPLGDVEQFLTKHSDKFSTACDPERISFLQKSDHETVIKSRRKRRRDDSPPPPPSDLKLNRIPEPRTYSRKRTKPTNHDIASSSSTSIVRENEVVDEVFEVKVEDPDELDNNNEEIFWQSKTPQESPPPEVKTQGRRPKVILTEDLIAFPTKTVRAAIELFPSRVMSCVQAHGRNLEKEVMISKQYKYFVNP
ncbi:uncharacterized protein LOC110856577 [Folsomia candida]|uniref:uncharacterized protein LOC110856577 n=1 Tax=Folsomia candida TaxID=158441 RepID=UPI001605227F|nr:uncharacterized protein LOC110856577 [Folsomia candida]